MDAHPLATGPAAAKLVGRHAELAALRQALNALNIPTWRVVQVAGEPGLGKTRLLAELCARAEERGCLVLEGRATEFEPDLPFGMFMHALDDGLLSRSLAELDVSTSELVAELACVFPSLVGQHPQHPAPLQEERYRAYRAVRVLLDTLSASRPLVFVLDDIHWADPASEELLSYLLRHPPGRSRAPGRCLPAFPAAPPAGDLPRHRHPGGKGGAPPAAPPDGRGGNPSCLERVSTRRAGKRSTGRAAATP